MDLSQEYFNILVTGNPIEGFSFHGPFEDQHELVEYAEEYYRGQEWWTASLANPTQYITKGSA